MTIQNRTVALFCIFTLFLFGTTYFLFGFFYETNDEIQMELFFRGVTVTEGSWNLYYWHRIFGFVWTHLYAWFPAFPWYGLTMSCFLLFAVANFLVILDIMARPLFSQNQIIGMGLFFFFFVFIENILLLNFLRVTTLLASSAVLLLAVSIGLGGKFRSKTTAWCLFTFFCAYQIRPEGGLLFSAVLFPVVGVWGYFQKRLKSVVLGTYLPVLVIIIFFKIFDAQTHTDTQTDDERIIPYIQTAHNFDAPEPAASSEGDPIKKDMVQNGFFWDRQVLTPEFLKETYPAHQLFSSYSLKPKRIAEAAWHAAFILIKNHFAMACLNGLLFALMLYGWYKKAYGSWALYLAFHLFFWATFIAVSVIFKMPNRLFTPFLVVYSFTHFSYALVMPAVWQNLSSKLKMVAFSILLVSMIVFGIRTYKNITWFQERCRDNSRFLHEISVSQKDQTIVFSKQGISLLNGLDPFHVSDLDRQNAYVLWGWFNWYGCFHDRLIEICGSDKYPDLWRSLENNPHHVVVSSPSNAECNIRFLSYFYQDTLQYQRIDTSPLFIEKTYSHQIGLYKIMSTKSASLRQDNP